MCGVAATVNQEMTGEVVQKGKLSGAVFANSFPLKFLIY
jgi:hypothetical protein